MEQQYELQKNESERKVSEMRKSIVNCHSELDKARERIQTTSPAAEKVRVSAEGGRLLTINRQETIERLELQRGEMERLQKKVQEQERQLEQSHKALGTVRRQVEDCQRTIKQHVGVSGGRGVSRIWRGIREGVVLHIRPDIAGQRVGRRLKDSHCSPPRQSPYLLVIPLHTGRRGG